MVAGAERLIVIAGPTGVGKTATAVALASRLPIEVISADSRQVYRGLDAATGKPTAFERAAVRHHLIDILDPADRYHAARFRDDALAALAAIRSRGRLPVVVGGTGLYIRALLRGLDPAPPADPQFRAALAAVAERGGRQALHERLQREAPALAERLHPNDSVRIIRALELARAGPVRMQAWSRPTSAFPVVYIGLTMDRVQLVARLRTRCSVMASAGLAAEVERLLARGHDETLPALQGIGYRDFVRVVCGRVSAAEALSIMQRDTIRYAKRQLTWFRREPDIEWIDVERAGGPSGVAALVEERVV
ncbi:MAG: tRNA (adenosine(37)-N6)-dimethylallyltransferase MiaA [Candidatus Rokuibacteriota bacterium]